MTIDGVWEAIGWIASAVLVISLLQTRIFRLRVINLIGCLLSIAYNSAIGSWPVVALNVALALINSVHLWRLGHTRHDPGTYAVEAVAPTGTGDGAVVRRYVANHAAEIGAIWPARSGGELGDADDVFLVLKGDEIVGLVALRRSDGGAGEVLLDYVSPPYRDFTPGEFVFRTSGVLSERGYRSVHAPLGEVDYYERIGFRRGPDGYRLAIAGA